MRDEKDYISYLIGIVSILLTVISFFKDEAQKILFLIGGVGGLVVAVVILYVNRYINKLESIDNEVKVIKNNYGLMERLTRLEKEVFDIKGILKNKKGKQTNIEDVIKVVVLLLLVYLLLKAIGVL